MIKITFKKKNQIQDTLFFEVVPDKNLFESMFQFYDIINIRDLSIEICNGCDIKNIKGQRCETNKENCFYFIMRQEFLKLR